MSAAGELFNARLLQHHPITTAPPPAATTAGAATVLLWSLVSLLFVMGLMRAFQAIETKRLAYRMTDLVETKLALENSGRELEARIAVLEQVDRVAAALVEQSSTLAPRDLPRIELESAEVPGWRPELPAREPAGRGPAHQLVAALGWNRLLVEGRR